MTEQQTREYQAWRKLVTELIDAGATTSADGRAPVGSTGTSGQRLYTAIRQWGDERAALLVEVHRARIRMRLTELEAEPDKQKWAREINCLRWALGE